MDVIKKAIMDWLREILIGGIISNLSGMFDSVNEKVGEAIVEVGKSPSAWNSSIFNMVQNLSETVMIPIAGVILAFVITLELIQLVTDRNNLHDIDTWMFFKWSFKTAAAVLIVTNTWNIVMGIFDVAQSVVSKASLSFPMRPSTSAALLPIWKHALQRWSLDRCSDYGFKVCSSGLPCGRLPSASSSSCMDA